MKEELIKIDLLIREAEKRLSLLSFTEMKGWHNAEQIDALKKLRDAETQVTALLYRVIDLTT